LADAFWLIVTDREAHAQTGQWGNGYVRPYPRIVNGRRR